MKIAVELNGKTFIGSISSLSLAEIASLCNGATVDDLLAAVAGDCEAITVHFSPSCESDFSFSWSDLEDTMGCADLDEDALDRFATALTDGLDLASASFCANNQGANELFAMGFLKDVLIEYIDEIKEVVDAIDDEGESVKKIILREQQDLEWRSAMVSIDTIGGEEFAALVYGADSAVDAVKIVDRGCYEGVFESEEDFAEKFFEARYSKDTPTFVCAYVDFAAMAKGLFEGDYSYSPIRDRAGVVWKNSF